MADTRTALFGQVEFDDGSSSRAGRDQAAKNLNNIYNLIKAGVESGEIKPEEADILKADIIQLGKEAEWDTSFIGNDLQIQEPGFDFGEVAGTVFDGLVQGVSELPGQVAGLFTSDGQQGEKKPLVINRGDMFTPMGSMPLSAGPAITPELVQEEALATLTKTGQLIKDIPKETYNTGVDLANLGYGYQKFDPITGINTGRQQIEDLNKYATGQSSQQLLQNHPEQMLQDIIPYVAGGLGTEKLASYGVKRLLQGAKYGNKARKVIEAIKPTSVIASEAAQGAVGANPDSGTARDRLLKRAEFGGQNAAITGGILAGTKTAQYGSKSLRRYADNVVESREIDKQFANFGQRNPTSEIQVEPPQPVPTSTNPKTARARQLFTQQVRRKQSELQIRASQKANKAAINRLKNKKLLEAEARVSAEVEAQGQERVREFQQKHFAENLIPDEKVKTATFKKLADRKTLVGHLQGKGFTKAEANSVADEVAEHLNKNKLMSATERKVAVTKLREGYLRKTPEVQVKPIEVPQMKVKPLVRQKYKPKQIGKGKLTQKVEQRAEQLKEEKLDTKENIVGYKQELTNDGVGIPASEVDEMMNATKPTGQSSWVNWTTWLAAKTGFGEFGRTAIGTKAREVVLKTGQVLNYRNWLIRAGNERYNNMMETFSNNLGQHNNGEIKAEHFDSGKFRGWWDGIVENSELTQNELRAYTQLKEDLNTQNKDVIIPLMEGHFGFDAKNLDVNKVSDAAIGIKRYKFDVTGIPDDQLQGLKVWETDTINPITGKSEIQRWVTLDYGNSDKAIQNHFNNAKDFYYGRKYPWLFSRKGEFRKELMSSNTNLHRWMLDLRDANKLTYSQIKNIESKFFDATTGDLKSEFVQLGYDKQEIKSLLSDIKSDNISPKDLYSRMYRMFVGALQEDKGIKLAVSVDVPDTYRKQQITMGNKVYRDESVSAIREKIHANTKKLDAFAKVDVPFGKVHPNMGEILSIRNQNAGLQYMEDMVRNKPPAWYKDISETFQSFIDGGLAYANEAFGKDWSADGIAEHWLSRKGAKLLDQAYFAETVLKMGGSVTAGTANYQQAALFMAAQLADNAPQWKEVGKLGMNPKALVQDAIDIQKAMHSDPKYGELYAHLFADADADVAFIGKGKSKLGKVGMAFSKAMLTPATLGIKSGQLLVYKIADSMANAKGLAGTEKSDFIFEKMLEASQVPIFTKVSNTSNKLVKPFMFLQNYMFSVMQYSLDTAETALRESAIALGRRKFTPELRTALSKAMVVNAAPILASGLKAAPGAYLVYNYILSPVAGNVLPSINELKASDDKLKSALAYGLWGTLGYEDTSMQSDPGNLIPFFLRGSKKPPVIWAEFGDVANTLKRTGKDVANTNGILEKMSVAWYDIFKEGLGGYLKESTTLGNRITKASEILKTGGIRDTRSQLVEDIEPKDRAMRATESLLGVKRTSETKRRASAVLFKDVTRKSRNITTEELDSLYKVFLEDNNDDVYDARLDELLDRGVSMESIQNGLRARDEGYEVEKSDLNERKLLKGSQLQRASKDAPGATDAILDTK